jgi:flavin-dependent dehydrogenase
VRRAALGDRSGACVVDGVAVAVRERVCTLRAPATVAADGRRSVLAFGLNLTRHPARPRRWAIGGYFESAGPRGSEAVLGEMHIRAGRYIGVAPVANGSVNVCVVKPSWPGDRAFADPETILRRELAADPLLRDRFAGARLVARPVVLGPLAVEATAPASAIPAGLVLAGDAAGFIDPMTGDGLRFAVRGGELAAHAVLRALEHGWPGVHARLAEERRLDFASKWRFNRAVRALVASPLALHAAAGAARVAPAALRALVARAGDCDLVP